MSQVKSLVPGGADGNQPLQTCCNVAQRHTDVMHAVAIADTGCVTGEVHRCQPGVHPGEGTVGVAAGVGVDLGVGV